MNKPPSVGPSRGSGEMIDVFYFPEDYMADGGGGFPGWCSGGC